MTQNGQLISSYPQLSQKSFKTCFRKLTIIASFIYLNLKNLKKIWKIKKKSAQIFLFYFSKLPPKRCPGGRCLHPQRPQSVLMRMKQKRPLKNHPPNAERGQVFLLFSIVYYWLSFCLSWFPNIGIEQQH